MKTAKFMLKLALALLFVAAVLFLLYLALEYAMPDLMHVIEHGNEQDIIDYVRGTGTYRGALTLFILQIIQVVIPLFPGMPIQIAAGIVYGSALGFLICYLGHFVAHLGVLSVAKRAGSRLEKLLAGGKSESRLRFITDSEYPQFMVFMAYLVPLLPNGIVPYVAARTRVSYKEFGAAVLLGSAPSIFVFCAVGNRVLRGDYVFAAISVVVLFAITALLFVFRDRLCAFLFRKPKRKPD